MEENYLCTEKNKNEKPPFQNCHVYNLKIPVSESEEIHNQLISQLIGKSGNYFKYLTQDCQLRYIWCNKETKVIDIWGKENNIPRSVKRIEHKIYSVLKKMYYQDGYQLNSRTIKWMENYTQNFQKF